MKLLPFLALLLPPVLAAQNLVQNHSFEKMAKAGVLDQPCQFTSQPEPFNVGAQSWNTFSLVTPDLLLRDSAADCAFLPRPRTGKRMLGLIMYHPFYDSQFSFDYHEYVQGTLARPLEKGKTYRVSFWARSDDSLGINHLRFVFGRTTNVRPVTCNNFGFYFSEEPARREDNFHVDIRTFGISPQVNLTEIVATGGAWKKYTLRLTADQPYRHFVFGNFFSDAVTDISIPAAERQEIDRRNAGDKVDFWAKTKRIAYYLFDDFSVVEESAFAQKPDNQLQKTLDEQKRYTFSAAVLFDTGSDALKTGAAAELESLADWLLKNPTVKMEIGGHTDNVGSPQSNRALSERRAASVVAFLRRKGIGPQQVSGRGYGESQPTADNATEAGRQQNRRVECRVI